jgi:hypothetical protein
MVLVGRYSILDIAGKYLLLILKPSSYVSKIEHIYAIEEGRAGEQIVLVSVAD